MVLGEMGIFLQKINKNFNIFDRILLKFRKFTKHLAINWYNYIIKGG